MRLVCRSLPALTPTPKFIICRLALEAGTVERRPRPRQMFSWVARGLQRFGWHRLSIDGVATLPGGAFHVGDNSSRIDYVACSQTVHAMEASSAPWAHFAMHSSKLDHILTALALVIPIARNDLVVRRRTNCYNRLNVADKEACLRFAHLVDGGPVGPACVDPTSQQLIIDRHLRRVARRAFGPAIWRPKQRHITPGLFNMVMRRDKCGAEHHT